MVRLVPMTQQEFDAYVEWSAPIYGREMVEAGIWTPEEAAAKCRQEIPEMLPEGLATRDQYFYTIHDDQTDENVGLIWLGVSKKQEAPIAYIYDFYIEEQHRRQGYGAQALMAAEDKARQLGLATIGLHVFGHNTPAIALYRKLGYEMVSIQMRKKL
jgi:ribosomal protein S18 acetylase RimI-like enzyme